MVIQLAQIMTVHCLYTSGIRRLQYRTGCGVKIENDLLICYMTHSKRSSVLRLKMSTDRVESNFGGCDHILVDADEVAAKLVFYYPTEIEPS